MRDDVEPHIRGHRAVTKTRLPSVFLLVVAIAVLLGAAHGHVGMNGGGYW